MRYLIIYVPGDTIEVKVMCTRPNYMTWDGTFTINDKPKMKFLGHHEFDDILKKQDISNIKFVQVPCGQCLECRIQQAQQWADRCVLEAQQYKHNYFVTLTYDDKYLPARNSLQPRDLQLFLKRLRKRFKGVNIRFLACGEYGDTSWRPHFHILLFNCPLNDLTYTFELATTEINLKTGKDEVVRWTKHLRPNNKGDLYYSRTIYECWHYMGMISVAKFNYQTASYVSQYVTKKCNPKMDNVYKELGIFPEFIRMSNRPGIGAQYFHKSNVHNVGHIIIPRDGSAHRSRIPRYFDKLFVNKYGEDVFLPIQIKRNKKKKINDLTYIHSNRKDEKECKLRDYNLKKLKRLRSQV